MYFVDSNNIITLSSNKIIKSESHHRTDLITRLDDLPWYQSLIKNNAADKNLSSEVMYTTEDGLLISQMPIQELNWRMFIVSPPALNKMSIGKYLLVDFCCFSLLRLFFIWYY